MRRSQIIDALRKAYVRDVVMIKNELTRKAEMSDEVRRLNKQTVSLLMHFDLII